MRFINYVKGLPEKLKSALTSNNSDDGRNNAIMDNHRRGTCTKRDGHEYGDRTIIDDEVTEIVNISSSSQSYSAEPLDTHAKDGLKFSGSVLDSDDVDHQLEDSNPNKGTSDSREYNDLNLYNKNLK